jgi:hypothetical protein
LHALGEQRQQLVSILLTANLMTRESAAPKAQKPKRILMGIVCISVLLVYAFSSGPAAYLGERGVVSFRAIRVAYAPLLSVAKYSGTYARYASWWVEQAHKN